MAAIGSNDLHDASVEVGDVAPSHPTGSAVQEYGGLAEDTAWPSAGSPVFPYPAPPGVPVAPGQQPSVSLGGAADRGLGPAVGTLASFGAGSEALATLASTLTAMAHPRMWDFEGKVTAVKYPIKEGDKAGFEIGGKSYFFPADTPEPNLGRILAALERSKRCDSTVRGEVSMSEVSEFWEVATPKSG